MNTSPPLQCSCGLTDFVDIRFRSDGVMTFTCFQCRKPMQINMRVVLAEQAWSEVTEQPVEPIAPSTPERPERYGYKFGGLL